jgi:hypothetical protein
MLCILIFSFLDSDLEHKRFSTGWSQAFPNFSLLLISSWIEFWSLGLFPYIWTLPSSLRLHVLKLNLAQQQNVHAVTPVSL